MANKSSANRPERRPGKLRPKVDLPETPLPARHRYKPARPWQLWAAGGMLLLIGAVCLVIWLARETRVTFHVNVGELKITDQPAVIYNFTGKVDLLRADYRRRLAPINLELNEVQNNLAAARADLAGKLERRRLLKGEMERLNAQIPGFIAQSNDALNDLWLKQGTALDEEYADTKEQYQRRLIERAGQLGVVYQRNREIDSIDVSVNAFKLALYGANKAVKVEDERKFAERLLAEWQQYQEDWQQRLGSMKDKSQAIRQQPGPKIEGVKEQLAKLRDDQAAAEADISSYQLEVRQYEARLAELDERLQQVTGRFMDDLLGAPRDFVKIRLKLTVDGTAELKNLEQHRDDFPAGDYFLLVTAEKDDQVDWALKKFTIKDHGRERIYVLRGDFVPARSYLSAE
ncbi:MAG: hypothetical protein LBK71_10940 [Verrucomicrobiales bacterium]|jgi:hypothetical protein|nr:hypothetical protein [Verrucomicrobiales bacterium]